MLNVPASLIRISLPLFLCALPAVAQILPKEIRGYPVHSETIVVRTSADKPDVPADAVIKIGDPTAVDISLSGVSFELPAEVTSAEQSGKVHFLTFHNFRVNGIPVEIEEYRHEFSFQKKQPVKLPRPAKIFLPTTRLLQAAWKEMRESREQWTITGRIFVFGKFRKYGFHHKRVVPIDIDVKISNPISIAADSGHGSCFVTFAGPEGGLARLPVNEDLANL